MKIYVRQLLLIAFFSVFLISLSTYVIQKNIPFIYRHIDTPIQTLGIKTQSENINLPVRLIIPKLNIDANIEYVGITNKGEMAVPSDVKDVGWFNLGPRPGEIGSAVIAGHFNDKYGQPAIFADLDKLKTGDTIYVKDNKDITTTFIVRKSRIYNLGYAEDVFSSSDGAHLNLITCDGLWNSTIESFNKRLVVFTDIY